jgi:uncharacterized protein (DUF1684 family)
MLRTAFAVIAPIAAAAALLAADATYQNEIAKWRKDYDRDMVSDKGPLHLIGRFNLPEGRSSVGSDASSRVRLPDRAPKLVGFVIRHGDKASFEPAPGLALKVSGKALAAGATPQPIELRNGILNAPRDRVEFGDIFFTVSGTQLVLHDQQSPYLKSFHGAIWFPLNPAYRVEAEYTPFPQPKELKIPDTTGHTRLMQSPGFLTFRLNGESWRLDPVISGTEFFIMFKDRTSAHETYGSGRFVEAEMPSNVSKPGKVILDFNKAYNPYCAFNPYSSCPIPPKQNSLTTRIEAGERYSGQH